MKKTLAFILVCALLVSAFTLTAFADRVVDDVASFTDNVVSTDIKTTVSTINHRYAVDVTYTPATYTLPEMTWNVNSLKYDLSATDTFDTPITVEVTNYSDLSVWSNVTVSDKDTLDFITSAVDKGIQEIQKVPYSFATNTSTTPNSVLYTITTNADLVQAVNYYYCMGTTGEVSIATYTVTVSQSAIS